MQPRVIIVHGWDGYPEEGWFPWLKNELEKKGFDVLVPRMPDPAAPDIGKWVNHLSEVVGDPNNKTFFVGHSIGCQTILRYLETLPSHTRIGGAIHVAGWFTLTNMKDDEVAIAQPWLTQSIDYAKIRLVCPLMAAIFSDNDKYVPLENAQFFEERLHSKIHIQKDRGHFSGCNDITELPLVLSELLEWSAGMRVALSQ